MDPTQLAHRLEVGRAAAQEAGRLTLGYFQRPDLAVERKADASPVTVADRQAEELLRERIGAAFPDDAIVGEEFPDRPGTSGCRWILDPIDGTKSFIHGVPLYGTLIGMESGSQSVLGIIHLPALDECVYAAVGSGAWHVRGNAPPIPARVSQTERFCESLFCTSEVASFGPRGAMPVYERLQAAARLSRTWGDCYGYMMVATGRAELMVDPIMNVWDAAAILPILEEAGGTFTDWQGRPTIHSGEGLATNGLVLNETLATIRG
ncbi:MAG TPA: histidinol-phosphatase [Pirellulales bacterium]|jgi:histidinol phosphatase-like enzyme (inositol monophosphatase family)|nr:histidinol-phosphatase [Pirellulales bacterium]